VSGLRASWLASPSGQARRRLASSANVLIVCGLKREAAILAGRGRTTLCGDPSTLRARLAEAASFRPSLVVSWGVCGGLDPRLRPGDLILGAEVVSNEGAVRTDEVVTASLAERLHAARAGAAVERFAASDTPVVTVGAKAELRRATGAAGVDMESLIAGQYALQKRIPFAILRAVADPAERGLPPLALRAVAPDGGIDLQAVVGELIRSPRQLARLNALAADSRAAFQALKRCRGLLPGLFLGLGAADL
jgi:adenosylhomocysteine nucleosidase